MSVESSPGHRFIVEAKEHLACMMTAVMALERNPEQRIHLEDLLRACHSLKGGAGFIGLGTIERLAHAMETAVERIRDGATVPTPEVIDRLLFALDRVNALVDDSGHSSSADIAEPMERLRPILEGTAANGITAMPESTQKPSAAPAQSVIARSVAGPSEFPISHRVLDSFRQHPAFLYGVKLDWFQCERACQLFPTEIARRLESVGTLLDSRMQLSGPLLFAGPPVPPLWYWAILSSQLGPDQFAQNLGIPCAVIVRLESVINEPHSEPVAAPTPPRPSATVGSLRIPVALIDRMMGLAGELVLIRNQATHSTDPTNAPARQVMRRLDSITNELQDAALRMRMQPVGTLFDRFPRLVRDLARQLGKQIECIITGAEVELDKTILEMLSDPLTHLVRNCCDHGIEMPDQRLQSGKPPIGNIRLSARQERGQILIEIRDDGRGLDREAIKRKAVQQGLKRSDELDRLSERQLDDLILLSGFSTATRVTDLSGRGVGMDVVRANLEQIGGAVEIASAQGQGVTFSLRLPLTLAIIPCLLMQSNDQRFVLPQRDIEEIVLLRPDDARLRIECGNGEEVLRFRGRLLPLIRLGDALARRQPFTSAIRAELAAHHHAAGPATAPLYAVVIRAGSNRFGLIVDAVLGSAEIVVKPLHALLRPLSVYTGATILGDGGVALILSGDGLARHGGITFGLHSELAALPETEAIVNQTLLLFHCGAAELLAIPLEAVRRVIMIQPHRIERVGDRELVDVNGTTFNVLRLERFLNVAACPDRGNLFLILPRDASASVALLASDIIDTPTQPVNLDDKAYQAAGVLGTATIRGQIAIFLDLARLVSMWQMSQTLKPKALPGSGQRILVVDDTAFFRKLVASCLESAGYEVVTACQGTEAIAFLKRDKFDLVVSDIEMPEMDGLALAQHVRSDVGFEGLPLMALSSLSSEEVRSRSLEAGFDTHEVKFDRDSFMAAVQRLLGSGRLRSSASGDSTRA
ncbi:MAG: chemotaxis protein CheW [Planctomycetes bacterium]|nr:chemotaxis protein CheW [Planctomycetota bacterium]